MRPRLFLLFASLMASLPLLAKPLSPPIPVQGLEVVLPRAMVGEREVSTARFTVPEDASRAADAIVAAWRAAGVRDVVRRDSGRWQIASRVAGDEVETVQLRDAGAGISAGLISRWAVQPRTVHVEHHPRRVLPEDVRWIDQLVSRDGNRVTVSAVVLVDRSVAALAKDIATRARALGFVRDPVLAPGADNDLDVAFYRKSAPRAPAPGAAGAVELVVTLERRGDRSAAVIHIVEEQGR